MKFRKTRLEKPEEHRKLLWVNWASEIETGFYKKGRFYSDEGGAINYNPDMVFYWTYEDDVIPEDYEDEFELWLNDNRE